MALKIVCLEEHVTASDIVKAAQEATERLAPYQKDLGSMFEEPLSERSARPMPQGPHRALELASGTLDERLASMDVDGIDMQVLSVTQPTQLTPLRFAEGLAQKSNDRLAELVANCPSRFAGLSTLPWQDPDAAVREVERGVHDLGLTGTLLAGTPAENALIDDPRFEPVLAALERTGSPLYIHPGPPNGDVQKRYYSGFDREVVARFSLYGWGWHNEAGVQVVRLILSGALDRHPNLKIVSGHWGEMVPFFLQRMDDTMPREVTGLGRTIGQTYRDQVFVTPSGMLNLPHFLFCREVLGPERIMFSVDYPYLTMSGARAWLEQLPVPESEREMIAHGNAEELLHFTRMGR